MKCAADLASPCTISCSGERCSKIGSKARSVDAPNAVATRDLYGSASMTRTLIRFFTNERARPVQNEVLPSPGCAEVTSTTCCRPERLGALKAVWIRTRAVQNREWGSVIG